MYTFLCVINYNHLYQAKNKNMTHIQTYMMLGCIATNLVAGNLWLLIGGRTPYYENPYSSVNFRLMIGASIACIVCYLFLFAKIQPATRNLFLLWLLSLAACFAIAMLGNTIAMFLLGAESIGDVLKHIITGLLTGFIGAFLFFPFIIPMSIINVAWLVVFVRNAP